MKQNQALIKIFKQSVFLVVTGFLLGSCGKETIFATPNQNPQSSPSPETEPSSQPLTVGNGAYRVFCEEDESWHSIVSFKSDATEAAWGARLYFNDPANAALFLDSIKGLRAVAESNSSAVALFEAQSFASVGENPLNRLKKSLYVSFLDLPQRSTDTKLIATPEPINKRLEHKVQNLGLAPVRFGFGRLGSELFYENSGQLIRIKTATQERVGAFNIGGDFLFPTENPKGSVIAGLMFDESRELLKLHILQLQSMNRLRPVIALSSDADQIAFEWTPSGNLVWLQKSQARWQIGNQSESGAVTIRDIELPEPAEILPFFSVLQEKENKVELAIGSIGKSYDRLIIVKLDLQGGPIEILRQIDPPNDHKDDFKLLSIKPGGSDQVFAVWQNSGISRFYSLSSNNEWRVVSRNHCTNPTLWQIPRTK